MNKLPTYLLLFALLFSPILLYPQSDNTESKEAVITINDDFNLLFKTYNESLKMWYDPCLINKQTNDTLKISGLSYENGSELDVRISPNGKLFVLDNIIKGYVEAEDGKETLHENYFCVIIDVEKAKVVETMNFDCSGEWDSFSNWKVEDKIIFEYQEIESYPLNE